MRKVVSSFIVITLCISQAWAARISQDDAALVANNFMNVVSQNDAHRAPAKRMVRKAAPAAESQYFIYENADGEGWVIIAANDAVTPILAYSETGHFRTDNMPSNVRAWMGKYDKFISRIEADGVEASEEAIAEWNALRNGTRRAQAATVVVGPLIKTTWDQAEPYWDQCPGSGNSKAYTGCVATAMAQVMKYWEWPKKGTGSHSYQPLDPNSETGAKSKRYGKQSADFGNTTYDWEHMRNSYSSSYTTTEASAVATLMFHCGVASEMMYGNDADGGSGTYTVNYGDWQDNSCAQNAFVNFFGYKKEGLTGYMRDGYSYGGTTYYKKWSDADWTAMVKEELDKQHPIMYGGAGSGGGHSFICDGYRSDNYFHFNWGWSGENDGYYTLSKLKPGSGGAGGGSYDFSEDQDVIIGIVPDRKDLPKVEVTWSVLGVQTTTEFTQEDALVLPEDPKACDSKVFVGWTAQSSVAGEAPADLFKTAAGKTVMEAITYYAVFANATQDEHVEQTNSYVFTAKNWEESSNLWASTADAYKYEEAKDGVQVTQATTGAGAETEEELFGVSKVVVNYCTNSTRGAGSITVKIGSKEETKEITKNGGVSLRDLTFDMGKENGKLSFEVTCTTNSIYIHSITVTTGGGVTYSDYSLDCTTTGVEEVSQEPKAKSQKLIINGQLFILHNGRTYNALGILVN